MQAAFAFAKKHRQSISLGAPSVAVTPVVLRQGQWPRPGSGLLFSSLSLGRFVVLGGSAHVQYLANGRARWDKGGLCTLEQVPPLWHQGSLCPWMLQESSSAGLAHVCKSSCLSQGKRSSLLPLRCSSPLEQMQSLSLCMTFWGGLCCHPQLSVPRQV